MEEPGLIATEAVMDHPVGAEAVGRDVAIFAARIRAYGDARAQAEREDVTRVCLGIVRHLVATLERIAGYAKATEGSLLSRPNIVTPDVEACDAALNVARGFLLAADARPKPTDSDHQQTTTRAGASEPPPARQARSIIARCPKCLCPECGLPCLCEVRDEL